MAPRPASGLLRDAGPVGERHEHRTRITKVETHHKRSKYREQFYALRERAPGGERDLGVLRFRMGQLSFNQVSVGLSKSLVC